MRDPKRIPEVLNVLKIFWEKHPDLRFFQLLSIISDETNMDLFYLEDEELMKILIQKIAGEGSKKS